MAVAARNFEPGMSPDSPIHATIAREIARTGEWFRLDAKLPDYTPYFADHPHLIFWLVALIFKLLPAADWSARIIGHLFYLFFLWFLFRWMEKHRHRQEALFTILLLWIFPVFSNQFSSVMMDPGLLFFGFLSVYWAMEGKGALAGTMLAFSFLCKGMGACLFLPAILLSFPKIRTAFTFSLALVVLSLTYFVAIRASSAPDFLSLYYHRQFTLRLGHSFNPWALVSIEFWKRLFHHTHGLIVFIPSALMRYHNDRFHRVLFALLLTSLILIAGNELYPPHHFILILPWIACFLSRLVPRKVNIDRWMQITAALSVVALFILQYLPIKTHGAGPLDVHSALLKLKEEKKIDSLIFDSPPIPSSFLAAAPYVWYGDVRIVSTPSPSTAYYLSHAHKKDLKLDGWKFIGDFKEGSLWWPPPPMN